MGSGLGAPSRAASLPLFVQNSPLWLLTEGLEVERFFMAIIDLDSPVFSHLIAPALPLIEHCKFSRRCPEISDARWLALGIARSLERHPSGRSFLQCLASHADSLCPENSNFFEALKSTRRLALCRELNAHLADQLRRSLPDGLCAFPCLDSYDVHVGDGHWHSHACHDARDDKGAHLGVGHLYTRNLRSGAVSHLDVSDQIQRKKEHDMRGLKRQSADTLRHGAAKGRKVLLVWDRAGIDFAQWFKWKHSSGLYLLSRCKENMSLMVCGQLAFDRRDPLNAGVLADELVSPSSVGITLRRVRFWDASQGRSFEFITNLIDSSVPPGVLAHLYRMRWDIEKTFDLFKNKFGEIKAWACSATAKQQQAAFLTLAHNLILLMEHQLATQQGVHNRAEEARRSKRLEKLKFASRKANLVVPLAVKLTQRCTQTSVKFIRWVAVHLWKTISLQRACVALTALYARL